MTGAITEAPLWWNKTETSEQPGLCRKMEENTHSVEIEESEFSGCKIQRKNQLHDQKEMDFLGGRFVNLETIATSGECSLKLDPVAQNW